LLLQAANSPLISLYYHHHHHGLHLLSLDPLFSPLSSFFIFFFFFVFNCVMVYDIQFMFLSVQGAKTGGITSGYPIRAQPVAAPPHAPSHVTTGSYQPNVSTPHVSVLY
jgi:hypothetical protein